MCHVTGSGNHGPTTLWSNRKQLFVSLRLFSLNQSSGQLSIREGTPPGSYHVQVRVSDNTWPDVTSTAQVDVRELQQDALRNAASIRLSSESHRAGGDDVFISLDEITLCQYYRGKLLKWLDDVTKHTLVATVTVIDRWRCHTYFPECLWWRGGGGGGAGFQLPPGSISTNRQRGMMGKKTSNFFFCCLLSAFQNLCLVSFFSAIFSRHFSLTLPLHFLSVQCLMLLT